MDIWGPAVVPGDVSGSSRLAKRTRSCYAANGSVPRDIGTLSHREPSWLILRVLGEDAGYSAVPEGLRNWLEIGGWMLFGVWGSWREPEVHAWLSVVLGNLRK